MQKRALEDEQGQFELTVLEPAAPKKLVLFAVGGGGNPERQHAPLLQALAERGCAVVAPHFERLTASPSEAELLLRARRLRQALEVAALDVPVVGIGHSIGAMVLLAFAGGRAWRSRDQPLPIEPEPRLSRLALLAPAAGYFQAPGALDHVRLPLVVWAGTADAITPLVHAQGLAQAPSVDLRIIEGAGHFSFLHTLPPGAPEPLPDRQAFLTQLTADLCAFATA